MTNEEIIAQVAQYEKGLNNPKLPDVSKKILIKKIEELKSQLAEKSAEKEVAIQKEEVAVQEDLDALIAKLEKGLTNTLVPEATKKVLKQKIEDAKAKLAASKKDLAEDKKEAVEEKKEVKEAVKEVEKLAKVRKTRTPKEQKVAKIKIPKVEEKKREQKSKERKTKLKKTMTDLERMISKNKELKAKYAGVQYNRLKNDSKRPAKPFGYRFRGKNDYRDPKKVLNEEQFRKAKKRGILDYEGRADRADKFPNGIGQPVPTKKGRATHLGAQLEHGGNVMADGGMNKFFLTVTKVELPNGQYDVYSYEGERLNNHITRVSIEKIREKMDIPSNAKLNLHYTYTVKPDSKEYKQWNDRKDIGYSNTEAWDEVFGEREMMAKNRAKYYVPKKEQDGGMMAHGGYTEKYIVEQDKDGSYKVLNTERGMYVDYVFKTKAGAEEFKREKDFERKTFGRESHFAGGGMMARGGKVGRKKYTYIPQDEIESISTWNGVSFETDEILDGAYIKGSNKKYADGGVMDDNQVVEIYVSGYPYYIKKMGDTTHFKMANSREGVNIVSGSHIGQYRDEAFYEDVRSWLKGGASPNGKKYSSKYFADGGVMAKVKAQREIKKNIANRLEELRAEIRAERISYGELAELQSLVNYIDKYDVELLEAAGASERIGSYAQDRNMGYSRYARGGKVDLRDDAQRFAKPSGWRWKEYAVTDGIVTKNQLAKSPTEDQREEYPEYVYYETRKDKSDKKPSYKYKSI